MSAVIKELKSIGQSVDTLSDLNTRIKSALGNSANISRIPRKGWRLAYFTKSDVPNTALYIICWMGLGALSNWFADYGKMAKEALDV